MGVSGLALEEGTSELPLAALSTMLPAPEVLREIEAAAAGQIGAIMETAARGQPTPISPPKDPGGATAYPPEKLALAPDVAAAPSAPGSRVQKQLSPWRKMENIKRALWMLARTLLFRPSFHNWYGFRRSLLVAFGAKLGKGVRIRPTALIEIPWNLDLGDDVIIGDYAILYSLGKITIGRGAIISQYAASVRRHSRFHHASFSVAEAADCDR